MRRPSVWRLKAPCCGGSGRRWRRSVRPAASRSPWTLAISTTKAGLFDAVVVPDGAAGVDRLAADRHVVQFVRDQYHQCKPILVLGAGRRLLEKAGIPAELPDGSPDPGLVFGTGENGSVDSFVAALAKHRHFERELEEQAH